MGKFENSFNFELKYMNTCSSFFFNRTQQNPALYESELDKNICATTRNNAYCNTSTILSKFSASNDPRICFKLCVCVHFP